MMALFRSYIGALGNLIDLDVGQARFELECGRVRYIAILIESSSLRQVLKPHLDLPKTQGI